MLCAESKATFVFQTFVFQCLDRLLACKLQCVITTDPLLVHVHVTY